MRIDGRLAVLGSNDESVESRICWFVSSVTICPIPASTNSISSSIAAVGVAHYPCSRLLHLRAISVRHLRLGSSCRKGVVPERCSPAEVRLTFDPVEYRIYLQSVIALDIQKTVGPGSKLRWIANGAARKPLGRSHSRQGYDVGQLASRSRCDRARHRSARRPNSSRAQGVGVHQSPEMRHGPASVRTLALHAARGDLRGTAFRRLHVGG